MILFGLNSKPLGNTEFRDFSGMAQMAGVDLDGLGLDGSVTFRAAVAFTSCATLVSCGIAGISTTRGFASDLARWFIGLGLSVPDPVNFPFSGTSCLPDLGGFLIAFEVESLGLRTF